MEALGTTAMALVDRQMGSRTPSLSHVPAERPVQGMPTSMAECRALAAWAEALPIAIPQPVTVEQLERHLGFLAATLPAKNVDDDAGRRRFAVYVTVLQPHPADAIAYMARRAVETLDWFPTPRQCLDLIGEFRRPSSEREATLRLCSAYAVDALERWLAAVRAGGDVGDVPNQWQRIAVEQGVMRRLSDGSMVSRARYHGPVKPYAAPKRELPVSMPGPAQEWADAA